MCTRYIIIIIIMVFRRPDGKRFSRRKMTKNPSAAAAAAVEPPRVNDQLVHTCARALVRSLAGNGNLTSILTHFIFRFFCRFSSIIYLSAH